MKLFERSVKFVPAMLVSLVLVACGGGGGSDPVNPPPAPGPGPGPGGTPTPTPGSIDPVNGFLITDAPIGHSTINDGAAFIRVADGTTAYSATIQVNGLTRRYVVVRPIASAANPPVLLLLHPSLTAPETMSNITNVSDYVSTQGFWAVLPESRFGGWDEDPANASNEDVGFISALIDSLISADGVDDDRIYASGFSSGGFMTVRLACELSNKIAAFGINAATLRNAQASVCAPSQRRAKVYFLGTADLIVPYNGSFGDLERGLMSAEDTLNYWAVQQGCGGVLANTLPDRAVDGTTVQQNVFTGCGSGTALALYTIMGGGHAWPGGEPSFVGTTTRDIAATGLIWRFVSGYRR